MLALWLEHGSEWTRVPKLDLKTMFCEKKCVLFCNSPKVPFVVFNHDVIYV